MSALGHKRTSWLASVMSALPPKADISRTSRHVRFVPKAEVAQIRHPSGDVLPSKPPFDVDQSVRFREG
jgi:hypothetical protein